VWGTRFPKLNLVGRILNQVTFACSVFIHLLWNRPRKPILVLTNPPFLAIICAVLRVLRIGPPFLYLIFDVYPDTAVRLGLLREKSWLARLWDRCNALVCARASAVIVIGRCMRDVIRQKLTRQKLPLDHKIHCIPMWCDDAAIRSAPPADSSFADRFGVRGKFVVGYFGNMGRFHDIETIMETAELLRDDSQIVFLFVGEGHKKRWALDYAQRHNLSNCRFHTYVDRDDLGRLLSLADIGLVSLSQGQEGLSVPSKTFGLMAAAVPVLAVVPPTSEIARMVLEEACGLHVGPGDKETLARSIRELFGDSQRRRGMGDKGLQAIEHHYSLKNASRQFVELIEGVSLQSAPSPSAVQATGAGSRVDG
jgi:glycosyltransferase involved in cell wall biosynthesis